MRVGLCVYVCVWVYVGRLNVGVQEATARSRGGRIVREELQGRSVGREEATLPPPLHLTSLCIKSISCAEKLLSMGCVSISSSSLSLADGGVACVHVRECSTRTSQLRLVAIKYACEHKTPRFTWLSCAAYVSCECGWSIPGATMSTRQAQSCRPPCPE